MRTYRETDFETLCEIDTKCFPLGIAYTPVEMRAMLKGALALVVENRRGRVVAFLIGRKNRVMTLDVLPGYQRRGIGRALMEAWEARLRQAGIERVWLETSVRNRPAQALYRSLGYSRVKRLPHYYLNGEDGWLLEKRLDVRPQTARGTGGAGRRPAGAKTVAG